MPITNALHYRHTNSWIGSIGRFNLHNILIRGIFNFKMLIIEDDKYKYEKRCPYLWRLPQRSLQQSKDHHPNTRIKLAASISLDGLWVLFEGWSRCSGDRPDSSQVGPFVEGTSFSLRLTAYFKLSKWISRALSYYFLPRDRWLQTNNLEGNFTTNWHSF